MAVGYEVHWLYKCKGHYFFHCSQPGYFCSSSSFQLLICVVFLVPSELFPSQVPFCPSFPGSSCWMSFPISMAFQPYFAMLQQSTGEPRTQGAEILLKVKTGREAGHTQNLLIVPKILLYANKTHQMGKHGSQGLLYWFVLLFPFVRGMRAASLFASLLESQALQQT